MSATNKFQNVNSFRKQLYSASANKTLRPTTSKSRPINLSQSQPTNIKQENNEQIKSYFESESEENENDIEWIIKSNDVLSITDFIKLENNPQSQDQQSLDTSYSFKDSDVIDFQVESQQSLSKYKPRKRAEVAATPESILISDGEIQAKINQFDNLADKCNLYTQELVDKSKTSKQQNLLSKDIMEQSKNYIEQIQKKYVKPLQKKIILNAEFGNTRQELIDKMIQNINNYNQISANIQTCFNPTPFQQKIIRNWVIESNIIGKVFVQSEKRSLIFKPSIFDNMPDFKFITPNMNLK